MGGVPNFFIVYHEILCVKKNNLTLGFIKNTHKIRLKWIIGNLNIIYNS